jgi:site-specific recombinase XerD
VIAAPVPAEPAATPTELVPVVKSGPLDRNPAAVYLAGRSAVGRRGLENSLNRAADILTGGLAKRRWSTVDWSKLRYQHVAAMRARLEEQDLTVATINHTLAAVRGVVREAWRLDLIDAQVKERILDVKGIKADTLPKGRHVDAGEIAALFRACDDSPVGARDAAMLALLYGCGLRRSEAVTVELADYADGAVTIHHGKGRKERLVYCPVGGKAAVDAWIARRGDWPGPLLCPVKKGGYVQQRGMTAQSVMMRLRFIAANAHVPPLSPHDLRRTFVGELLDAGADISSVQKLAGHSNVATTTMYDRRPENAKRRTAELLHVPFAPGTLPYDSPAAADAPTAPDPDNTPRQVAQSGKDTDDEVSSPEESC